MVADQSATSRCLVSDQSPTSQQPLSQPILLQGKWRLIDWWFLYAMSAVQAIFIARIFSLKTIQTAPLHTV